MTRHEKRRGLIRKNWENFGTNLSKQWENTNYLQFSITSPILETYIKCLSKPKNKIGSKSTILLPYNVIIKRSNISGINLKIQPYFSYQLYGR